jgi:hypothetical protein
MEHVPLTLQYYCLEYAQPEASKVNKMVGRTYPVNLDMKLFEAPKNIYMKPSNRQNVRHQIARQSIK